jgi:hypothetical protein
MIDDIRKRHKQDEAEFNNASKGLVHQDRGELLSLIDKYQDAFREITEIDNLWDEPISTAMRRIAKKALEKEE